MCAVAVQVVPYRTVPTLISFPRHFLQEEGETGAFHQPQLLLGLHWAGPQARAQDTCRKEGEGIEIYFAN